MLSSRPRTSVRAEGPCCSQPCVPSDRPVCPTPRRGLPTWVVSFDERNFLLAPPALELLLATDGRFHPVKALEVNQPMHSVRAGEPVELSTAVLSHARRQTASPNVSQGGGERAKSSSIRRRSALNLRKSSYGPSPAGLLAVLAPKVSIFCQGKTHHSPNSACCPNSSRYSLPFSQQRRAVTCNCRYTWRNSSR